MKSWGIRILAAGKYLPSRIVTNDEMGKMLDVPPEWIFERSGIRERRWVEKGSLYTSDLAAEAAKEFLKNAKLGPDDVDCFIFATLSPDHMFPGIGNYAQRKIGVTKNTPCIDIRQQCTGFIFGTQMAAAFCSSGTYKRVMVIGAEIHSTNLDHTPAGKNVTMLFGDGAGAVIYERTEEEPDHYIRIHSAGEFADILRTDVFDVSHIPVNYAPDDREHLYPHMEGKRVFLHAVEGCKTMLNTWLTDKGQKDFSSIDTFLLHQANQRINDAVAHHFQIAKEKTPSNIHKYGNCSAGSIPILMTEAVEEGRIKPGQTVAMLGFGSGFNFGISVLRFGQK